MSINPRTVAIIQARCGSSRFPNKVLQPLGNKSLLAFQLERLRQAKTLDALVVATTGSPTDDPLETLCRQIGAFCFRGSERDVLDRYYRAAQAFSADIVVRLTADCPFIDPAVVDQVVQAYGHAGSYDFVANTVPPPGTFPDGMDVEVFSFRALETAWREARKPSEREHVTFFFWKQPERFKLLRVNAPEDWSGIRLTVDYPDDLERLRKLHAHFEKENRFPHLEDIVQWVKNTPELISSTHEFGAGWTPSLRSDERAAERPTPAPPLKTDVGETAWKRALKRIPTGSQTFSKGPNQFVNGVAPKMLIRGRGSKVWDLDGNEYIDYTLGLGPAILGHCHPEVDQAAAECATNYFAAPPLPHPLESVLAEKLSELIPSAEMVRFGKNGSDATAGAVRLARAYTKRDIVACCGYHGWQDWYIGSTSRSNGVPQAVRNLVSHFEYNDIDSLARIFKARPGNVAAVILEPVSFAAPEKDFLQKVRELASREGAVLIFDEIVTGFRLDLGGAQRVFGVTPDLSAFGKALANGYPLSVLCGRGEIMQHLKDVFFSFTLGGELPPIAAALKTLEILERDQALPNIARLGRRFRDGINEAARQAGAGWVRCIGLDFWPDVTFTAQASSSAQLLQSLVQQEVVRRGVLTRAASFISAAHSDYDIDFTIQAYSQAIAITQDALDTGTAAGRLQGDLIEPVIRSKESIAVNAGSPLHRVLTIEARMTSSRLPGKVLMTAGGKPLLQILIERLKRARQVDEIVVATTTNETDDPIVALAQSLDVGVFRGSEHHVLERVCGALREHRADVCIEITADCPTMDPALVDEAVSEYMRTRDTHHYISNGDPHRSVPDGMDVQVFSAQALYQIASEVTDAADREHVSYGFYRPENGDRWKPRFISHPSCRGGEDLFVTLDYAEDYELIRHLHEDLSSRNPFYSAADVVAWLKSHPQWEEPCRRIRAGKKAGVHV